RTGRAALDGEIGHRGIAPDMLSDPKRPVELQPVAGPHAARQRHRWQEPAAFGMAVGAGLRQLYDFMEEEPVPGRRNGITLAPRGVVAVEGRGKGVYGESRNRILPH